jgi:hypothetical protein
MSTKTNFKRIALVAVASLGLGILSSVPSQATTSNVTLTTVNGTATTVKSDSTTAATVTVNGYVTGKGDTIVVSLVNKTAPSTAGSFVGRLWALDTTTAVTAISRGNETASVTAANSIKHGVNADSVTAGTTPGFSVLAIDQTTAAYVGAKFGVLIESSTVMPVAGTYTFTILTQVYSAGALNSIQPAAVDVSIVVSAVASASLTASAANSTALMSEAAPTTFAWQTVTTDSTVAVSATASSNNRAVIRVTLNNVTNTVSGAARESITVSIDKGLVGLASGGAYGRSLVLASTSAFTDIGVRSDGTAGVATIKISTPSVVFPNKSITFYGTGATIKAGAISTVVGNSGNLGVWGTAADASGTDLGAGTDLYAYSSDTSVISNFGTACTWNSTLKYAECSLTAVKDGTASITLRDASTVAGATIASNVISVRAAVNKVATSYKLVPTATSYAPGAPGVFLLTVYDADGKVMPAGTYSNLFTSTGLTANMATGTNVGATLASASVTTEATPVATATKPVVSLDPVTQYYFYFPVTGGTFTLTHKGGSSLPLAAQVTTTTSTTITDNAAAALAAVSALATTVASLKTLITTLTNLVLKIQKKVKA